MIQPIALLAESGQSRGFHFLVRYDSQGYATHIEDIPVDQIPMGLLVAFISQGIKVRGV